MFAVENTLLMECMSMSTLNDANFDFSDEFNEILVRASRYSPEITKSDSNIARVFDVSRTTPATWRTRKKTPIEAIIDYAKRNKINIHWLLTGEEPPSLNQLSVDKVEPFEERLPKIDLALFDFVTVALLGEDSEIKNISKSVFNKLAVEIYNQACDVSDEAERQKVIGSAVRMLSISLLKNSIEHTKTNEAHLFPDGGKDMNDSKQKRINELSTVTQHIEGTRSQVAGRDLVNKGK